MREIDCPKYDSCLEKAAKADKEVPCNTAGCPSLEQVMERARVLPYPVFRVKQVRAGLVKRKAEIEENIKLVDQYLLKAQELNG